MRRPVTGGGRRAWVSASQRADAAPHDGDDDGSEHEGRDDDEDGMRLDEVDHALSSASSRSGAGAWSRTSSRREAGVFGAVIDSRSTIPRVKDASGAWPAKG